MIEPGELREPVGPPADRQCRIRGGRLTGVVLVVRLSLLAGLQCAAPAALAATLTLGLVQRDDDERLDPRRLEQGYPGQPGGTLEASLQLAADESRFELDAAKLAVKLEVRTARDAVDAKAQIAALANAGAAGVVLDLPAAWLAGVGSAAAVALLNAGEPDDAPRGAGCAANLFHTLPGERMRADALAQALLGRRWSRVLVLHGPRPADAARLALVQAALKRYGLKTVATKPFKLSADPRERDLANPLLLSAASVGEYDAVWVVDTDGEFARGLPYRTALPRPVVGDAGLVAEAWMHRFERFGAPQLSRRFARANRRPMTGPDWAGYVAAKAVLQAALERPGAADPAAVLKALRRPDFTLDGFKGVRLSFRPWDRQLRQPLVLTDGVGVIGLAPIEGVLHPRNVLDTLGADAPESACKAN